MPQDRLSNLDKRPLVVVSWAAFMAVYLAGEILSPYSYGDARFVIDYLKTELVVTALLVMLTVLFLPATRIGFRRPVRLFSRQALPMYTLAIVAIAMWAATRGSLPSLPDGSDMQSLLVLRTTAFVGLNEEWIFRGMLLAAMVRWWGLRAGAFGALGAFSAFHLLNIAGGVPPLLALVQLGNTFLLGSVFLLGAIATRSLLIPIVVHALYDFAVIDAARLIAAGAESKLLTIVPLLGLALGALGLFWLSRLKGGEPYADD